MVQKPVGQQGLHDGQFVVLGRRLHHGEFGRRVEEPRLNHGEEVAHHLGGGLGGGKEGKLGEAEKEKMFLYNYIF